MHRLLQLGIYVLIIAAAVKIVPKLWKKAGREAEIEEIKEKKEDLAALHEAAKEAEDIKEKEVKKDKEKLKEVKKI